MNTLALSTILALLAIIRSCSALAPIEARQATVVAVYVLTGYSNTGTPYPNYTVSVPENGVTIPITNPLIVYSISPIQDLSPSPHSYVQANCTFTLEDGTKAYVTSTYDIIPQKVVSVSCVAAQYPGINISTIATGLLYPPTPTVPGLVSATSSPGAVGTISGLVPPYPTTTGPFYYVPSTTGASGSAAPSASGVVTKSLVPFTGGAGRAAGSVWLSLGGFLGVWAAL